jgi:superfamily II DNA or RNA helicase
MCHCNNILLCGGGVTSCPCVLASDYDIVLLPVSHSDRSPCNSALVRAIEWHRLILDESHQGTGNVSNKIVQQIKQLRARSRWLLTGTPIGAKVDALQGQLSMLGFELNWFTEKNRDATTILHSHR